MNLDQLTGRQREVAFERLDILKGIEALQVDGNDLETAIGKMGLTRSRYFRWQREYRQYGVAGLADKTSERRAGKLKMDEIERAYMESEILSQNAPKAMTVYDQQYLPWCRSQGIQPVSYSTFKRRVDEISAADRAYHIGGKKRYSDGGASFLRDWSLVKPLEIILSDHMQTNALCLNPSGKIVRPWLTWWMDGSSRMGLSWTISEQPNQDTINYTLFRMISQYSAPKAVYIDNGKDYTSKAFMGVSADGKAYDARYNVDEPMIRGIYDRLSIDVHFALPYNAKAKHIEPAHKYIQNLERLGDYYGYVGPNILERPERMSGVVESGGKTRTIHKDRLMSWEEYTGWYDEIMSRYNHHNHSALGMSAADYFAANWHRPDITIAEDALRLLMMKGEMVKVSPRGVQFQKNWYKHPALIAMEGQSVVFRYDPMAVNEKGEVEALHVYDLKERYICTAGQRMRVHPLKARPEDFAAVGQEKKIRATAVKERTEKRRELLDAIGY